MTLIIIAGCNRLHEIGDPPPMDTVSMPHHQDGYRPILHTPSTIGDYQDNYGTKQHQTTNNSLWHQQRKTMFSRAGKRKVGDIINVIVKVEDSAKLENSTDRSRGENTESLQMPNFMGLMKYINKVLPGNRASMLDLASSSELAGSGKVDRAETITTEVSSMVTQILPNGNLVVKGKQEIRVNHELREIQVAGIVNPADVDKHNSIYSDQIAEARISYGGRGIISDVQQPRLGQEIVDIIAPF